MDTKKKKQSDDYVEEKEEYEKEECECEEENAMEANIFVVVYFVIILFTTAYVLYAYPKNGEFWFLFLAFIIWVLAGMLSIWYAWMNGKKGFAAFFFVIFIGLYWITIYNTLSKPI